MQRRHLLLKIKNSSKGRPDTAILLNIRVFELLVSQSTISDDVLSPIVEQVCSELEHQHKGRKWPLGINPDMDNWAIANGYPEWSCLSCDSNLDWWRMDEEYARLSSNSNLLELFELVNKRTPFRYKVSTRFNDTTG